jgi:DNA-binding IclR family transcriptional regulator
MSEWSFLTNHARAVVCIAHDPGIRLRDIGATLGITERAAFGIVTDLTDAGYVVKNKDGNRNRYHIQHHLPVRGAVGQERTIGEVLELLVDTQTTKPEQPSPAAPKPNRQPPPRRRRARS